MQITTDMIVGAGLVLALILSIIFGGASELQTTIASGLVGYMGRAAMERREERRSKDDGISESGA